MDGWMDGRTDGRTDGWMPRLGASAFDPERSGNLLHPEISGFFMTECLEAALERSTDEGEELARAVSRGISCK